MIKFGSKEEESSLPKPGCIYDFNSLEERLALCQNCKYAKFGDFGVYCYKIEGYAIGKDEIKKIEKEESQQLCHVCADKTSVDPTWENWYYKSHGILSVERNPPGTCRICGKKLV